MGWLRVLLALVAMIQGCHCVFDLDDLDFVHLFLFFLPGSAGEIGIPSLNIIISEGGINQIWKMSARRCTAIDKIEILSESCPVASGALFSSVLRHRRKRNIGLPLGPPLVAGAALIRRIHGSE